MKRSDIALFLLQTGRGPIVVLGLLARLTPERFTLFRTCLEGAAYNADDKTNTATVDKTLPILKRLHESGFTVELSSEVRDALTCYHANQKALAEKATLRADKLDANLRKRGLNLYPFQKIGIEWLAGRTGALLADQMGLGKSIQALTAMPQGSPILIVCPSVLKGVWRAECDKWRPDMTRIEILSGRGSFRWPLPHEMLIVNFDVLPKQDEIPSGIVSGTTCVFDEAHALKNPKSKRTVSSRAIADTVRAYDGRTWALTATPLLNNPSELWSVLQAVGCAREAFGSYTRFFELFGGSTDKWGGVRWSAHPNPEVVTRLQRVSLRRERAQVLPDLPEKTYRIIDVPIDRATTKLADRAWKDIQRAGVDLDSAEAFAKLQNGAAIVLESVSQARSALCTAKIPSLLELVDSFEAQNEPVVVFSRHRAPIDVLAQREGWETITGDNSSRAQEVASRFQAGELKGLAATIQAGGVGITLTRSAHVIFVDLDWTPALNEQAEDRCCRIGQTRGVVITILLADHTMDKHVSKVVRKKELMIERTVAASARGADEAPLQLSLDEVLPSS